MTSIVKVLFAFLVVCGTLSVVCGTLSVVCGTLSGKVADAADPADRPQRSGQSIGWRGDGSGQYPSANPVSKWTASDNVRWKTEVGAGQSSPIVVGTRVFITSEPNVLVCLDAESGRELWRKAHQLADISPEAAAQGDRLSGQYGDATPTPVSDGKWLWFFLGQGIVACHDLEGNCRWVNWYDVRRTTRNGRTASPVLVNNRLLVHFGSLVCLDSATGKLLWQNDQARATYGTPAVAKIGKVDVVVTPKGQVVRVSDGTILATDLGNCMYTSPVVKDRVVYFVDGAMTAVQLPQTVTDPKAANQTADDEIECKELWAGDLEGEFFASPLIHDGRLYTIDKAGKYYVIDANSGKTILSKELDLVAASRDEASVYPSPCLAAKHLIVSDDTGKTIVLEAGDQGTVVSANTLPGGSGGTPTFSSRRMFVRGGKHLYCLAP
jgi:outer membrane protein assembly factor BamB